MYDVSSLSLIFRHELIHLKRRDLWFKLVLTAIKIIHWFNPFVRLLARQANKDIEIICDMQTVQRMDINAKKQYSELLLSMASGNVRNPSLSTCMNGGKKMLKQRFTNILGCNKRKGIMVFVLIGIAIAMTSFLLGVNFAAAEPDYNEVYCEEYAEEYAEEYVYDAVAETAVDMEHDVGNTYNFYNGLIFNGGGDFPMTITDYGQSLRVCQQGMSSFTPLPAGVRFQVVFRLNVNETPNDLILLLNEELLITAPLFSSEEGAAGELVYFVAFDFTPNHPVYTLDLVIGGLQLNSGAGLPTIWIWEYEAYRIYRHNINAGVYTSRRSFAYDGNWWSFGESVVGIQADNIHLAVDLEVSNVRISSHEYMPRVDGDAIRFMSYPAHYHAALQSSHGDDIYFMIFNHDDVLPEFRDDAVIDISIPYDRDFCTVRVILINGDIILEDVTVTESLYLFALNGKITLRNVNLDGATVIINGNLITDVISGEWYVWS